MAYGLTLRENKRLNLVDPASSTEKKTQQTIHLWKARPQFKCFYTILCVFLRPAFLRKLSRERGEWGHKLQESLKHHFQFWYQHSRFLPEHQFPPVTDVPRSPKKASYFLVMLNSHFTVNLVYINQGVGKALCPVLWRNEGTASPTRRVYSETTYI